MKSEVKYCSTKTRQLLELEVFHFSDEMVSADIQMHLAFVFFAGEVGKYAIQKNLSGKVNWDTCRTLMTEINKGTSL